MDELVLSWKGKAEAFDRIVEKYVTLSSDAGFYSKNWVELAEVIEREIRRVENAG